MGKNWTAVLLFAGTWIAVPAFAQEPAVVNPIRGEIVWASEGVRAEPSAVAALAGAEPGSGLEVDDYRNLKLIVEEPSRALQELGLTRERIRRSAELRLRSLNFTPLSEENPKSESLHIAVRGLGDAFDFEVSFERYAGYFVFTQNDVEPRFNAFRIRVRSWTKGTLGTHRNNPSFILSNVERFVDDFLFEYLAANLR